MRDNGFRMPEWHGTALPKSSSTLPGYKNDQKHL